MSISVDTIRIGKKYYIVNYGERHEFIVLKRISEDNFLIKDLLTLEKYELQEFMAYGKGDDFELFEL
ncbi:hypothetical protein [Cytophaga hutchinsonii]|uniref:Uncharacterized protein n=1 Tax=Cytophaga hutchinsonii (strain ATCC 33406 / DSM 1761 / CIP 103989 / NBRC 15051 / NCIMB 9469 / D465) TaxID=269798 RepID=A0A6N4SS08_CYTH3|nr:hypothetical protein [Cytophaga hutchinsonii]ABG59068.1 hypothetical protein CHU_1801 [Cytophaga hutchinsonii ATCC 33406]SFX37706.1 hypothetical protein SAMN04487930_103242 [Cytophaga hutchinsonii ATCC 33406]